ncbi:aminoglycoside phosphotransferase [Hypoxylon sp. FL1150]|nr:aminoglycoside phosphotransferase [Hypoxylon sp. FL1150]
MASKTETCLEELPALPSDVTAQWLESKLGHKIASVSLSPTRSIFGTAGKLFFTIEYADEAADPTSRPTHICMKGVFDPAMAKSQPWTLDLAQREAQFFEKLAPLIKNMGYPRGWWGGKSDRQGIAIMSDLVYEGCTFPPQVASYPLEKVLDGAAQIAALHARFWGKSQEDHPWITNDYDACAKFIVEPWDTVVREPGRPKLPEYLLDGTRVKKALGKYFAERNPRFRTLVHGDAHLGNIYFTAEGRTCFLDWSAFHFASCFHDLVYFVTTTQTIEARRAHEMEILDHYLATLRRLGGPKLNRNDEELITEYRRSFMNHSVWFTCGYDLHPKERVDAFTKRALAAWVDHKVIETVEAY